MPRPASQRLDPDWHKWPPWAKQLLLQRIQQRAAEPERPPWPSRHMVGRDGQAVPFHRGQELAWQSKRRITAMLAGSQSGKTSWGPWWLYREILKTRGGDHLVVTASYDLFKLRLLPAVQQVFEEILRVGRYWAGDRVLEIRDPESGHFKAVRSSDQMWARVILRSAESLGGLESSTARSAWLDEAGQPGFTIEAWRAVQRRLSLYRGRELITTTLYHLGWISPEIIDAAEEGGQISVEQMGDGEVQVTDNPQKDIMVVQFDSIVNPSFPKTEWERARAAMPDDEFQMFYRGRKAILRGLVYDCFQPDVHIVPDFAIPVFWRRYNGLDFGGTHFAGVFVAEEPGTDRFFAYREYMGGGLTGKGHSERLLRGERGRPVAYGGSKSEKQWRDEMAAAGYPVREPPIYDLNLGIAKVYSMFKNQQLYVFQSCRKLLAELRSYRRKRDVNGNPTDDIQDKETYHLLDGLRYVCVGIQTRRAGAKVIVTDLGR